jgi:hypothetical protein
VREVTPLALLPLKHDSEKWVPAFETAAIKAAPRPRKADAAQRFGVSHHVPEQPALRCHNHSTANCRAEFSEPFIVHR